MNYWKWSNGETYYQSAGCSGDKGPRSTGTNDKRRTQIREQIAENRLQIKE
jgi:hypothetical protein